MDTSEVLALFRNEVRDNTAPYLWSDAECFGYMDRAQKDFCRHTGGISDSRSSVTRLTLVPGTADYRLHPSIMKIKRVGRDSDGGILELHNVEDLMELPTVANAPTGVPEKMLVDADTDYVRLYPTPEVEDTLHIFVFRRPLSPITEAAQPFEISEQHHYALLDGVCMYAHRKQDAETFDKGRADSYEQRFLRYCDDAKHERELREHKQRLISYGGLPCGPASITY